MLPGVCVKKLKMEDIVLPKGVHRYQGGPGKGQGERRRVVRPEAFGAPQDGTANPSPHLRIPLPKAFSSK